MKLLLGLLAALGLTAFSAWHLLREGSSDHDDAPAPLSAMSAESACVVAQWRGGSLTKDDVQALRAVAMPAPGGDDGVEWAIDVSLIAERDAPSATTPKQRVDAYRDWLANHKQFGPEGSSARRAEVETLRSNKRLARAACDW